jgi:dolichol-phosphate mannosyltransferase
LNDYVPNYRVQELNKKVSQVVLIIPVINESFRLRNQIVEINKLVFKTDIIIADGGSDDGSLEDLNFFKQAGVNSILFKLGPGKLSAQLQTAFHYALENGYSYIITMDGNGKDGPSGIETISRTLQAGIDFVQGSRFLPGGASINTPKMREIGIRYLHAPLTSLAARYHFTDTTNGFRGYSRHLIESKEMSLFRKIFSTYELIFYIPIRASRTGFSVEEVPVSRSYPSGGDIPTKILGLRSHLRLIKILFQAVLGLYNPREI